MEPEMFDNVELVHAIMGVTLALMHLAHVVLK